MPSASEDRAERLRRHVRQAFILFEHKEGSRLVDIKDIPTALRACGVNPTQMQVSARHVWVRNCQRGAAEVHARPVVPLRRCLYRSTFL